MQLNSRPLQTCHRFCTDRQGMSSRGTEEPRSFPACSVPIQLSTRRQQILELAHGQAASPELVYFVGHAVCRIFQTPAQTRTPGASRKRLTETRLNNQNAFFSFSASSLLRLDDLTYDRAPRRERSTRRHCSSPQIAQTNKQIVRMDQVRRIVREIAARLIVLRGIPDRLS